MTKKIAIIGTGISGMGAAYMLSKEHDITVYEKNDYIGGHTRTKVVEYDDRKIAVDTGFIVCNDRNYPNLMALFEHLKVPLQKSDMCFAITVNDGAIEWGSKNLNTVFGQRRNLFRPDFLRMLRDILKFNQHAGEILTQDTLITLGELLDRLGMRDWFRRYYILPMGGAIWSCPLDKMEAFPAQSFVQFFDNHGLLTVNDQPQWYTVTGGSQNYVKKLTRAFKDRIRLNTEVTSVTRGKQHVSVTDISGATEQYDEIVLACHGDEALAMLRDASDTERNVLSPFTYQTNIAYLHRDVHQMPMRKACWASWVYQSDGQLRPEGVAVTYWMNLLQSIDRNYPLFVTLNPIHTVREDTIFNIHEFTHPIYTREAIEAQAQLPELQGQNHTWFCGAYHTWGFHEDGLASAVRMCEKMGVKKAW